MACLRVICPSTFRSEPRLCVRACARRFTRMGPFHLALARVHLAPYRSFISRSVARGRAICTRARLHHGACGALGRAHPHCPLAHWPPFHFISRAISSPFVPFRAYSLHNASEADFFALCVSLSRSAVCVSQVSRGWPKLPVIRFVRSPIPVRCRLSLSIPARASPPGSLNPYLASLYLCTFIYSYSFIHSYPKCYLLSFRPQMSRITHSLSRPFTPPHAPPT